MNIEKANTGPLGVNTYLVTCEATQKCFMVDPGGESAAVVSHIQDNGLSLEYVILTHGHSDHMGGVSYFMEAFPQAKLVAAAAEAELLSKPRMNASRELFGKEISLHPDILMEEDQRLAVGQMELQFLMTPGHTPGGMCIWIEKEAALFSGDTLFYGSIGRTDLPGGDYHTLIDSIRKKLLILPENTAVFPGHMDETQIGFEKRNNPYVSNPFE